MSTATGDAQSFSNISASSAAFTLRGGKYAVSAIATGTGTMGLQMLMPDGATFNAVHTAFSTTAGFTTVDLPPGQYKFVIATFTAVYASVCRVPT